MICLAPRRELQGLAALEGEIKTLETALGTVEDEVLAEVTAVKKLNKACAAWIKV